MTTQSAPKSAALSREDGAIDIWRIGSIVLMVLAIGISAYLSYAKLANAPMACNANPVFDCGTVQYSVYSMFLGVPVAVWGFLLNLAIFGALVLEDRIGILQTEGPVIIFGLLLFATLFSIWLIYVQGVLLQAWCPWCLSHEVVIFAAFAAAIPRLVRHLRAE